MVQTLSSLQSVLPEPTHTPPTQLSVAVHALLSSHAAELVTCLHPDTLSQESSVQTLLSSQFMAVPATHVPPAHLSPRVQLEPSSHGAVLLLFIQPSLGLHVSVVQTLSSLQSLASPGRHAPAEQTSPSVHILASLQVAMLESC